MNDNGNPELTRLQSSELTERTPFCPEDQVLAEYFGGELKETEQTRFERHLTDCGYCLARIGVLGRLEKSTTQWRIPGDVLASAKQIKRPGPSKWLQKTGAWATAAVLVIALLTAINMNNQFAPISGVPSTSPTSTEPTGRQLRNIKQNKLQLIVHSPKAGAEIGSGALIRWDDIPGNLHYNIFILSDNGDVLWTERMADAQWPLQDTGKFNEGGKYYFRVVANLQDGRSVSSKHLAFRFSGQR